MVVDIGYACTFDQLKEWQWTWIGKTKLRLKVQQRKQSGSYLDGIAPDGLLGLGMADISVPSFLARAGLVRNSFSMCFKEYSGRIFFGDQGVSTQQSTPFVPLYGKL